MCVPHNIMLAVHHGMRMSHSKNCMTHNEERELHDEKGVHNEK